MLLLVVHPELDQLINSVVNFCQPAAMASVTWRR